MADYIYLLESRLSKSQQNALTAMRQIAREKGLTIFLVGGAVRDLTSGSPVRDLDVAVQGNALKLKKDIEKAGGRIIGEHEPGQALYVQFPRGVKLEVGSTVAITYPKPGKPVVKAATILDDLRRRDFTANAMALSLNDGSYGLLMDPLNGVADIENRELRLVSNYGFIEDPIRMVRAARLMARLGWQMDEKTAARYATGKQEGYISAASKFQLGYEAEEIVHEEDPLRVLTRLEAEGWMKLLAPAWTAAKVNVAELERLRESQTLLQMQGIHPNTAAANFPLLTAKLAAREVVDLKASFPRQGFVKEIESLEAETRQLAAQMAAKSASLPSEVWKLLHSAKPEAVLMVAHASKNGTIQERFKSFYTDWPLAKQKIPYNLMQEMRIHSELPGYKEFLDSLVFELMDGKLNTLEEMRAFLEPFSPPAPPPPVHLRRPRAAKKESKAKGRSKKLITEPPSQDLNDAESPAQAALEGTAMQVAASGESEVSSEPKTVKHPPEKPVAVTKPVAPPSPKTPPNKSAIALRPPAVAITKQEVAVKAAAKVAAAKIKPTSPKAVSAKAVSAKAVSAKPVSAKPVSAKVAAVKGAIGAKSSKPTKKAALPKRTVAPNKPVAKPTVRPIGKKPQSKLPAKKVATKLVAARPHVKTVANRSPAKAPSNTIARKSSNKSEAKTKGKTVVKTAAKKVRR